MSILITGAAGFIGFHTAQALLKLGHKIIGVDNLNNYYDPSFKKARLELLKKNTNFEFSCLDVTDFNPLLDLASKNNVQIIIHLAAQPGVRYSLIDPFAYTKNNVDGQLSILEVCRNLSSLKRLVYASSSSVYGANTKVPYSEVDPVNSPISLYAATKRSCELISESYRHLFAIPMIGLRFFTVYGPWGRPDMAPFIFTKSIFEDKPIDLFNYGKMERDFTYIDDIVNGIIGALESKHTDNRVYNLGNHNPISILEFVNTLENIINKKAKVNLKSIEPGDVVRTYADIELAHRELGFEPKTKLEDGLRELVHWFSNQYKL
jgi:UDP-glucuronate 4-epimerase